jgi:hypothetical protein
VNEERFTPEDYARLHQLRHREYADTATQRALARQMTDKELRRWLDERRSRDEVWFAKRTGSRVRKRVFEQELHSRRITI